MSKNGPYTPPIQSNGWNPQSEIKREALNILTPLQQDLATGTEMNIISSEDLRFMGQAIDGILISHLPASVELSDAHKVLEAFGETVQALRECAEAWRVKKDRFASRADPNDETEQLQLLLLEGVEEKIARARDILMRITQRSDEEFRENGIQVKELRMARATLRSTFVGFKREIDALI